MSLPFLKPEKLASSIVESRRLKKDGSQSTEPAPSEHPPELLAAAEDLIRQVQSKSASGVASALCNFYDLYDSREEEQEGEQ